MLYNSKTMTEKSSQHKINEAYKLASQVFFSAIREGDIRVALVTMGYTGPEEVATLDRFLNSGALQGSGLIGVDDQIQTINQVRGMLKSFLPELPLVQEEGGVKQARRISNKDARGKADTGGAGFEPFG